jgi:hypothetical protein
MIPMNGHWIFPEQMGNKAKLGFIYVIVDQYMDRLYLGKKSYRIATGPNTGRETDWRYYTSSSKILNAIIKERPKSEFRFYCIEEYSTKGGLSYAETWSLCYVNSPLSEKWYNKLIPKISWAVREGVTARHITTLSQFL